MYCSKCGKPLSDGAAFCSYCGAPVVDPVIKPAAGDDLAINDGREIVIKEGLCNRVKSKFFVQNGHGLLTNKRFIYSKHSLGKILVTGAFVNLTKGSYEFEIPIDDIAELADGRQGVSKTIIIRTKSGEEYNFYFSDRQVWLIEFGNLIGQP